MGIFYKILDKRLADIDPGPREKRKMAVFSCFVEKLDLWLRYPSGFALNLEKQHYPWGKETMNVWDASTVSVLDLVVKSRLGHLPVVVDRPAANPHIPEEINNLLFHF